MIPAELRDLPQWVAWRYETRGGKPTKVPLDPACDRRASSTDPSTWSTYRQALSTLNADGIGFVFSADDPYVGLDLDNCIAATGVLHDAAYEIVAALGGYVEFSPSATGLHIIVRGQIPRGRHTLKTPWGDELAVYDRGRFFTMSGEGRLGAHDEIPEAQEALSALVAYYFPEGERPRVDAPVARSQPVSGDDAGVLERIHADPRIAALWRGELGDHGGDHSAADMALCAHLAFYTGNDGARMDALFRRSGLWREKWDEKRGDSTYGAITISRAMKGGA